MPRPFLDFLDSIKSHDNDTGFTILKKISDAFDKFSLQIHDELTVNVFEALKIFSEGIITNKLNQLQISNDVLEEIREQIFILLYRIIFILYAEDRSIFPVENEIYKTRFSLKWIKYNWISISADSLKLQEYEIQERLNRLFRLIEHRK